MYTCNYEPSEELDASSIPPIVVIRCMLQYGLLSWPHEKDSVCCSHYPGTHHFLLAFLMVILFFPINPPHDLLALPGSDEILMSGCDYNIPENLYSDSLRSRCINTVEMLLRNPPSPPLKTMLYSKFSNGSNTCAGSVCNIVAPS